jgi:CRISPR-associated protein Csd1
MIIDALLRYYEQKAAADTDAIAPPGFEFKEIPFELVIDRDGRLVEIEDRREPQSKFKRSRVSLVPQAVKRTAGVAANVLWDTVTYVCGIDAKDDPQRAQRCRAAFVAQLSSRFGETPDDPGVAAVLAFQHELPLAALQGHPLWPVIVETGANLIFRLDGDLQPVHLRAAVRAQLAAADAATTATASGERCLVSGAIEPVARLHPSIKGVNGAQSSGASLVSFNASSFCSHGKEQGANAPMGERAAFAYTTALNRLLGKDSKQKVHLSGTTVVYWTDAGGETLEAALPFFFDEPPKDDPDARSQALELLWQAARNGTLPIEEDRYCYALGLSPNAARVSVRFFERRPLQAMATQLRRYFDDLAIDHDSRFPPRMGLRNLLKQIAALGDLERLSRTLEGEVLRAVLRDGPLPRVLLSACLERIRGEAARRENGALVSNINTERAALLKACLNRAARFSGNQGFQEITVMLDESNVNTGYRLGRAFAVLEKIQADAQNNINATIRDRYYGSASTRPQSIFPTLLKLSNHHLKKIDNPRFATAHDKRLQDVLSGIPSIPARLNLADQAHFALGYYHQRRAFFIKTSTEAGADPSSDQTTTNTAEIQP